PVNLSQAKPITIYQKNSIQVGSITRLGVNMNDYKQSRSTTLTLKERFQATIVAMCLGVIMIVILTYWPGIKTFFPRYHEPRTNSLSSELIWSREFRRPISMEPIGNDNIVVVLQDGKTLTALDNLSGQVVWEYTLPERMNVLGTSRHVFD